MRPYVELPGFEELVLEESYVLGIEAVPGAVTFAVDFVLTPGHPAYAPPPEDENESYRRGTMRFTGVKRLEWSGQGAPPATDATGEADYGHIDDLQWDDNRFELEGDWGRMVLEAERVTPSLDDHE